MEICSAFTGYESQNGQFLIHTNRADVRLCFLTPEIVRLRASFSKKFDEESYVLAATAWEDRLDPLFGEERTRLTPAVPAVEETEEVLRFSTASVCLEVQKNPLCFRLYDAQGDLLHSDVEGNPFVRDSNGRVLHYSRMEYDDCFYGFGEKGGSFNKAQRYLRLSAKDAMGYDPIKTDSLYKHIPFYLHLSRRTRKAVGLFYHNQYECAFNMGCEKSNYWPYYSYYAADGGDIDLFLIAGGEIGRILDNYTLLTGRPALLPKRALGYQGSSMYYPELEKDCDEAVLSFVDTAKEEGFPIDGFHLSSGYTAQNGKRCVFTWNRTRFKDPEAYFAAMNQRGAQNVPNVKPGVLLCHPLFSEFEREDVFVKDSEGKGFGVGKWWGGDGAFWDFTNPRARDLWKRYLTDTVLRIGTNSVWNDNCEYDSLMDKDCVCCFDGKGGTIGQLKPNMATLMCRLACQAVEENDPDARPYVVCRSGGAGIQKYAQTWCGDNFTSWDTLRCNIGTILGMGLSGCPSEGADVGGFYGPAPSEELFVRWVQNGIFQPRFSIHSTNTDNTVTEPWMYSGSKELIRQAILLRYRFLPYLYSALYEAHCTGAPIMRPLVLEFQDDPRCWEEGVEFLFGRDILVANVVEEGAKTRTVYLPAGCSWYDFYTCRRYEGGREIEIPVGPETIPLFLREGAVVPMALNQPMNMERDPVTDLLLRIVPGGVREYVLYEDDGVTNDYRKGVFRRTAIRVESGERVVISFSGEGTYPDPVRSVSVEIVSPDKAPYWVKLGDRLLPHSLNRKKFEAMEEGWYYSQTTRSVLIRYPNPRSDAVLTVSFEQFDLIGM